MTEIMFHFAGGCFVGACGAISPGPDTILILRSVAVGGRRAGTRAALGIGAGLVLHAIATALLIVFVKENSGRGVMNGLQLAGAGFLAYLGASLLRGCLAPRKEEVVLAEPREVQRRYFWQGFLTNVTNPKVVIFFVSIVSPFLAARNVGSALAMLTGVVLAVPAWFVLLSVVAARLIGEMRPQRRRLLDLVTGIVFISLALYSVITALV